MKKGKISKIEKLSEALFLEGVATYGVFGSSACLISEFNEPKYASYSFMVACAGGLVAVAGI